MLNQATRIMIIYYYSGQWNIQPTIYNLDSDLNKNKKKIIIKLIKKKKYTQLNNDKEN